MTALEASRAIVEEIAGYAQLPDDYFVGTMEAFESFVRADERRKTLEMVRREMEGMGRR